MTTAIFQVLDPITPGDRYTDGRRDVIIARVVAHGSAPRKVWYRYADGRQFTLGASESWRYADEFLSVYRKVEAGASESWRYADEFLSVYRKVEA